MQKILDIFWLKVDFQCFRNEKMENSKIDI